jgi:hypothetical protein
MAHFGNLRTPLVLLAALCCASPPGARAANCVVSSSWLVASTISPEGQLVVVTYCPGESPGCTGELPMLEVERAGTRVPGSVELLYAERTRRYVVFRPSEPWTLGPHQLRGMPTSFPPQVAEFEVTSTPSSFRFDEASVSVTGALALAPLGARVCCPSTGEGDCSPSCGGLDGEQRVAEVRATHPLDAASVIWRMGDADAPDAELSVQNSLRYEVARASYCARIEAWDVVDGTRHEVVRCTKGFDGVAEGVGESSASWSSLAWQRCSAPPVVGGYGYDIFGDHVPTPAPAVDERLRAEFCEARRDDCGDQPAGACASPYDCPCRHYAEYCSDQAEGAREPSAPSDDGSVDGADAGEGAAVQPSSPSQAGDGCSLRPGQDQSAGFGWLTAGLVALLQRRRARRS